MVKQGIVERFFGLASVFIQNAAGGQVIAAKGEGAIMAGIKIPGQTLDKANRLSEIVRSVILTKNSGGVGL